MKVRVIEGFIDKETNEVREKGTEFECSVPRYEEIKKAGKYVEPVKKETEKRKD